MTSRPAGRREKLWTWSILTLALLASLLVLIYVTEHEHTVAGIIRRAGVLGPLIALLLYGVLGSSPIPSEIITFIVGAVYGPFLGTLIGWLGNMEGALIEYGIGTRLRNVADFEARKEHLPLGLGRFPADSLWFLIVVRVIPGYGPKMVGVMSGVYRVNLWRYTWTAAIPNFIGAVLFAAGGYGAVTIM